MTFLPPITSFAAASLSRGLQSAPTASLAAALFPVCCGAGPVEARVRSTTPRRDGYKKKGQSSGFGWRAVPAQLTAGKDRHPFPRRVEKFRS